MNTINVRKFGLAFGITGSLLYLGCAVIMLILGHVNAVIFFNSLLHGLDVSAIMRMDISPIEAALGIIQTFILGWLIGACIAVVYNFSSRMK